MRLLFVCDGGTLKKDDGRELGVCGNGLIPWLSGELFLSSEDKRPSPEPLTPPNAENLGRPSASTALYSVRG